MILFTMCFFLCLFFFSFWLFSFFLSFLAITHEKRGLRFNSHLAQWLVLWSVTNAAWVWSPALIRVCMYVVPSTCRDRWVFLECSSFYPQYDHRSVSICASERDLCLSWYNSYFSYCKIKASFKFSSTANPMFQNVDW